MKSKPFKFWFASLLTLFLGASIGGASALEKSPDSDFQIETPVQIEPLVTTELKSSSLVSNSRTREIAEQLALQIELLSQFLELDNFYITSIEHSKESSNHFSHQMSLAKNIEIFLSQFNFYQYYKSPDYLLSLA